MDPGEDDPEKATRRDRYAGLPSDPDTASTSARPLHLRPSALAWVFSGGVVGTALRYVIEEALPHGVAGWPWATFLINLSGAFVLGGVLEALSRLGDDSGRRRRVRLLAGTGGCGAFTTNSTFSLEVVNLGRHGHVGPAVGYGVLSVVGGVVAAWLGIVVAARVHRRRTTT
jgi:CrcB protein